MRLFFLCQLKEHPAMFLKRDSWYKDLHKGYFASWISTHHWLSLPIILNTLFPFPCNREIILCNIDFIGTLSQYNTCSLSISSYSRRALHSWWVKYEHCSYSLFISLPHFLLLLPRERRVLDVLQVTCSTGTQALTVCRSALLQMYS